MMYAISRTQETLRTFIVLLVADGILTSIGLEQGAIEANPLWRSLSLSWGYALAMVGKSILGTVIAIYLWRLGRSDLLKVVNIGFFLIVCSNLSVLIFQTLRMG